MWNVSTGIGSRLLGIVGTMLLTWFLTPDAVGTVGVATVVVLTASQLTTIRFGHYLIAERPDPEAAFAATVYHNAMGLVAIAFVIALAEPLASLANAPTGARFIPGLAVAVLLERVAYVPSALLVRDMRFRALASAKILGEVLFVSVALGLVSRWGAMSIVAGQIARYAGYATVVIIAVPAKDWLSVSRIRRDTTRRLFRFGLPLAVASLAEFGAIKWDNLMVSRFFSAGVMGIYNLAYNLAELSTFVADQVGDVLFPSLSRMNPDRRAAALVRAIAILGLIVFPFATGIGVVSHTLVAAFFKPAWQPMADMLTILSALSVVRPVSYVAVSYFFAEKSALTVMWLGLFKVGMVSLAILTIGRYGPLWTCVAVSAAFALVSIAMLGVITVRQKLPLGALAVATLLPLVPCAVMAGCVLMLRRALLSAGMAPGGRMLALEIATGAIVYVPAALVLARPIARDAITLVKNALSPAARP